MILPLVTPLPFCYQFHWNTKPISQGSRQVAVEERPHSPLRRDALMTLGLFSLQARKHCRKRWWHTLRRREETIVGARHRSMTPYGTWLNT